MIQMAKFISIISLQNQNNDFEKLKRCYARCLIFILIGNMNLLFQRIEISFYIYQVLSRSNVKL